ncbi:MULTISPECIES: GerAB/ArcD/ProY family transporter [Bacillaceae]|uniref:Spore germination protein n=1 Tax=Evansella alkalicola TaxID=745819 RepID=A0ABS6JUL1_9BACI|nr:MULTISPECIES: GerAB/ArcD/ProY family transporter [Bacillaceae]MBU9720927.1 spore germination protein [Bacillus alkalicola]
MDKGNFKKLNKYHVIFLLHCSLGGIALFTIPHNLSHVGYNMWMVVILFGIVAMIFLKPMTSLGSKFPDDTLYVINEKLTGKAVGKLLNLLILIYSTIQVANTSKLYIRLVQSVTMPDYTITMIAITFFIVMIAIINGGIKSIARFSILSFFLTVWMGYYSNWAFADSNFHHLYPRFEHSLKDWGHAFFEGSQIMLGFALIMFFYPYIINQKKAYKHAAIGIWLAIIFIGLICVASIVYFSRWQLENLLYPLLNLYQAVVLSNVERIETLGISLYVLLVLSKASIYLWTAKKGVDALFSKHKNKTWHLYFIASVALFIVLGPIPIYVQALIYDKWIIIAGYVLILLPIFLLMLYKVKNREKRNKGKEASAS